jgi:hypothetical protein
MTSFSKLSAIEPRRCLYSVSLFSVPIRYLYSVFCFWYLYSMSVFHIHTWYSYPTSMFGVAYSACLLGIHIRTPVWDSYSGSSLTRRRRGCWASKWHDYGYIHRGPMHLHSLRISEYNQCIRYFTSLTCPIANISYWPRSLMRV